MIYIMSIHIIDTMTLFITLTLHSWLMVYVVFFQTLKLFPTQTALTFPRPMVCKMVYQITDTTKMLLTQYTQTAFVSWSKVFIVDVQITDSMKCFPTYNTAQHSPYSFVLKHVFIDVYNI